MDKDKTSVNNQTQVEAIVPNGKPILKSAKNMAGYAEDKEIDPKLMQEVNCHV